MTDYEHLKYQIDVCDDEWLGYWMHHCPYGDPFTITYWLIIGSIIKILKSLDCCEEVECSPLGSGGLCGDCPPGHACTPVGDCCSVPPRRMAEYQDRLDSYFYSVVPSLHPGLEQELEAAIIELECGATAHWGDLQDPGLTHLTMAQVNTIWIRRVAMCIRNDIEYGHLGYGLSDCSWEQLNALLRLHIAEAGSTPLLTETEYGHDFVLNSAGKLLPAGLWANNPHSCHSMALAVLEYIPIGPGPYGTDPKTQLTLALIDYMRHELDWAEPTAKYEDGYPAPRHNGVTGNIEDSFELGTGGCVWVASVLRQLLRTFNVPTLNGTSYLYGGHGGFAAWFGSSRVAIKSCCDTLHRYGFKWLPAEFSFESWNQHLENSSQFTNGPTGACQTERALYKQMFIEWLSHYNTDDPWEEQLFSKFYLPYIYGFRKYGLEATSPPASLLNRPISAGTVYCTGNILQEDPELWPMICFVMFEGYCSISPQEDSSIADLEDVEFKLASLNWSYEQTDQPEEKEMILQEIARYEECREMCICPDGFSCVDLGAFTRCSSS